MVDETMVRIVDALFRHLARQMSLKGGLLIEDAIDGLWVLLEGGSLRLVVSDNDGGLAVEPCGENRAERHAQAKANRRLVEFKRQMGHAAKPSTVL